MPLSSKRPSKRGVSRKKTLMKSLSPSLTKWFSPSTTPAFVSKLSSKSSPPLTNLNKSTITLSSTPSKSTANRTIKADTKNTIICFLGERRTAPDSCDISNDKNNRLSVDSHTTLKKNIESNLKINCTEVGDRKQDLKEKLVGSNVPEFDMCSNLSFGMVKLAPVPPEAFDPRSKVSKFQPKPLDYTHPPTILRENAIIGRSVSNAPLSDRRKRKRMGNKIDLGIPVNANGISRKQIKVCKIYLEKEKRVTFQVMEGIKNEFFVSINKKWFKPPVNSQFTLRVGDCIFFDIYEWQEKRCAQYVYQLTLLENPKCPKDEEIINLACDESLENNVIKPKRIKTNNADTSSPSSNIVELETENNGDEIVNIEPDDILVSSMDTLKDKTSGENRTEFGLTQDQKNKRENESIERIESKKIPIIAEKLILTKKQCDPILLSAGSHDAGNPINFSVDAEDVGTPKQQILTKSNQNDDLMSKDVTDFLDTGNNSRLERHNSDAGLTKAAIVNLRETSSKSVTKQPPTTENISSKTEKQNELNAKVGINVCVKKDKIISETRIPKTELHTESCDNDKSTYIPSLLLPDDQSKTTLYTFKYLSHLQFFYSNERQKTGLKCAHCFLPKHTFQIFPSSSRNLKTYTQGVHEHYRRCTKFPPNSLLELDNLEKTKVQQYTKLIPSDSESFYNNLWERFMQAHMVLTSTNKMQTEKKDVKGRQNKSNTIQKEEKKKETIIPSEKSILHAKNAKVDLERKSTVSSDINNGGLAEIKKEGIVGTYLSFPLISVGCRIAVQFERYELFGVPQKSRTQWFFASVTKIENSSLPLKLEVEYDDKTSEVIEYPHKEVVKLKATSDGSMIFEGEGADDMMIAYMQPDNLFVGDLVDVRSLNRSKWYRGRVAKVNSKSNTCNVAYDDKDYELYIPINFNNIRLISRGWVDCSWLIGVEVRILNKHLKVCGTVENGNHRKREKCPQHVMLKLSSDGFSKNHSYRDVVSRLFSPLLASAKKTDQVRCTRDWQSSCSTPIDVKNVSLSIIKDDSNGATDDFSESLPTAASETNNLVSPIHSPAHDDCSSSRSCISQDLPSGVNLGREFDGRAIFFKEMIISQSNSLWRALSSTEPQNAYGILTHAAIISRTIPNQYLLRNIHDSIINGLKSEGSKLIDPNKSELTRRYATLLIKEFVGLHGENGTRYGISCCTWEDIENCLSRPIISVNLTSKQMSSSLLEAVNAIEYILTLFQKERNDIISRKPAPSLAQIQGSNIYKTITKLFDCPGGLHGALKCSIKWTSKSWFQYGVLKLRPNPYDDAKTVAASRLLKAMGKVTAIIAWMFCLEEGVKFGHKKCNFLIRDVFIAEFNENSLETNRGQILRDLKLGFILSLEADDTNDLRLSLASMFDLKEEIATILGICGSL